MSASGRRGLRGSGAGVPARAILVATLLSAVVGSGCAGPSRVERAASAEGGPTSLAAQRRVELDAPTEDRILALTPERISEQEVTELLARAPAPRILCLHGSLPIVTMQPFAEFLVAMGYPEASVRDPRGTTSHSSFVDSRRIAGVLAWYYEREGMMPILIGHSQGGMIVIKALQDLAGESADRIAVWNPLTDEAEARFAIVDPRTGAERPVVGLKVGYAAAIATGSLPRLFLAQWAVLPKLRNIPDSVEEFTGFLIEWDLIAGTTPATEPFRSTGTAVVRTVMLPVDYGHLTLPLTTHLATNPMTRVWVNSYVPGRETRDLPAGPGVDATNILHAAEIWYSVKKRWCIEAQRHIRARRGIPAGSD